MDCRRTRSRMRRAMVRTYAVCRPVPVLGIGSLYSAALSDTKVENERALANIFLAPPVDPTVRSEVRMSAGPDHFMQGFSVAIADSASARLAYTASVATVMCAVSVFGSLSATEQVLV